MQSNNNYSLRSILAVTIPSITALLGLIWYFGRKKKDDDVSDEASEVAAAQSKAGSDKVSEASSLISASKIANDKLVFKGAGDQTLTNGPPQTLSQTQEKSGQPSATGAGHIKGGVNSAINSSTVSSQGRVETSPDMSSSGDASVISSRNVAPEPLRLQSAMSRTIMTTVSMAARTTLETSDSGDSFSRSTEKTCTSVPTIEGDTERRSARVPKASESVVSSGKPSSSPDTSRPKPDVKVAENKNASGTNTTSSDASGNVVSDRKTPQQPITTTSDSPVVETLSCASSASLSLSAEKPQSNDVAVIPALSETQQLEAPVHSSPTKITSQAAPHGSSCPGEENQSHHDRSTPEKVFDQQSNSQVDSEEQESKEKTSDGGDGNSTGHDVPSSSDTGTKDNYKTETSGETKGSGDSDIQQRETGKTVPVADQEENSSSEGINANRSPQDSAEGKEPSGVQQTEEESLEKDSVNGVTGLECSEKTESAVATSAPSETKLDWSDSVMGEAPQTQNVEEVPTSSGSNSSRSKSDGDSDSAKPKPYRYNGKWSTANQERKARPGDAADVCADRSATVDEAAAVRAVTENGCGADPGSPSCDTNSEESNDSGRGGSLGENLVALTGGEVVHYELSFPSELCGRLIGRQGRNIHYIKEESGATVALSSNPFTPDFQICRVQGLQAEVDKALLMIRKKFPLAQYPQLAMIPIGPPQPSILIPEVMQLDLPEGVSVEVVVSAIVNAGHIFVQQPTHPSFPSLESLMIVMNTVYSDENVPSLPRPVEGGVICASESEGQWYRAQVMQVYLEDDTCDIKYVDYGGYARVPASSLKQIRSDFMTLPFQAVECYLANITPLQEEDYFSENASMQLAELTANKVLQGQVILRAEDNIPYVHIYQVTGHSVLFVNREMVNREVVRWIEVL
ncbi:hypothetical protein BaRGS_00023379 [Batillaria attramentaria]|uniref:Tudor domain-containing protein n=1 Tax=Batillaria attramentaria TaxID=370345 RepID=A0ABD0KE91_9CAEN